MSLPEQSVILPRQIAFRTSDGALPFWLPPLFYLALACLFLWRSLFTGEVFLPAGLLGYVAPYAAQIHPDHLPAWNVLRWDGIAQFYPWRLYAATAVRAGVVPLWNPYQFCGTPFVANSQSAVFYPGNLLFYLLPTTRAFACSALLHLTLAGWFLYLLLRRLGCSQSAGLLGGVVYAYSAWQVAWLQLPTFLATSCWFPLLLRQVYEIGVERSGVQGFKSSSIQVGKLGAVVGVMLLAGHLQVAFYGLLAGIMLALMLLVTRGRSAGTPHALRLLAGYLAGLALGLMLAAPQLLPSIELSRYSHRAGKSTAAGYAAYTEYALPAQNLITLVLPDFYGNDTDPGNPYWGFYVKELGEGQGVAVRHNAAETALYVGIVPLLLGSLAVWQGRRDRKTLFFAGLAALALLLALGTPLNALFYFGIPGFGQSGSPARVLALWALAAAVLAAFGLDRLRERAPSRRELAGMAGALLLVLAVGLSLAARAMSRQLLNFNILHVPPLGDALARIGTDWARLAVMAVGGLVLFTPFARRARRERSAPKLEQSASEQTRSEHPAPDPLAPEPFDLEPFAPEQTVSEQSAPEQYAVEPAPPASSSPLILARIAIVLAALDLLSAGILSNLTSPPEWVYPETDGIKFVREQVGHERIFPVNQRWSLYQGPAAVLPPNGAMVYGFRDVQGYDSLLTGQYKTFANRFARERNGTRDASPPEVGNMVFFQDPNVPLVAETGARFALTLPPSATEFVHTLPPPVNPIYADEMAVYPLPNAQPRARLTGSDRLPLPHAQVAYVEDGPTRVTLDIDAPSPGTLTLADQYYPGWQASVDGRSTPMTRSSLPDGGEGIGRNVPTPAGRHRIAFRYAPTAYRLGLYLACLALSTLAATLIGKRRK